MKVQKGQRWTIHRGSAPDDPMVIDVLDVDTEGYAFVKVTLRSNPRLEIQRRHHMHPKDLLESAALESGPGTGPNRRSQIDQALQLIRYSAKRHGKVGPQGVTVPGREIIEALLENHDDDRTQARLTLRAALAELGGTEQDDRRHDFWADRTWTETTLILPAEVLDPTPDPENNQ